MQNIQKRLQQSINNGAKLRSDGPSRWHQTGMLNVNKSLMKCDFESPPRRATIKIRENSKADASRFYK